MEKRKIIVLVFLICLVVLCFLTMEYYFNMNMNYAGFHVSSDIEISNLVYKPIRVINDKIYDIEVTFSVGSKENKIIEVVLFFIPKNYSHIPRGAFPEEEMRVFKLRPVDGKYDEIREDFRINITGIVGGREYLIKVIAKDSGFNLNSATISTEYFRQFENIANLDDLIVGVFYYPWYLNIENWEKRVRTPLLGLYNSRDSIIISKHIDWATGHGIDLFLISWWGPMSPEDLTIKEHFLKNPLSGHIKFCILYESEGRFGASKNGNIYIDPELLISDFKHMNQYFFNEPNYFKVNNHPVVFLYLSRDYSGNLTSVFSNIRSMFNAWILGDFAYWQTREEINQKIELLKLFDGISTYTWAINNEDLMKKGKFIYLVSQRYSMWKKLSEENNIIFIPGGIMPGFNDDNKGGEYPNIDRDVEFFRKFLLTGLNYIDYQLKMLLITSFNEWIEDTQIEPSDDYSFDYLNAIKQSVEGQT